ncbi:hypothetical protein [Entomobacter blattae]|uniref:Uncharacterized protein n=1 Tax=Entomobacter blattae TaxID=2762277 RepID=A0A7H1NQW8_9PROT|nr:hypothetical protein [Entomobacter blattae]QNT78178.1 hypothetical protein JGUZn3_09470 [Entomobacter blattae]
MKKALLSIWIMVFLHVISLNFSYAKQAADLGTYSCTTDKIDQCNTHGSIVYIHILELRRKFHYLIGSKNDKIVSYLYNGKLFKQFGDVFTAFVTIKQNGIYYYLTGSRYQSLFEKGIAVFTEKGKMVGAGILYYPCAPVGTEGCSKRAHFAIYVKDIPKKDEIVTNMKAWINGIMKLDSFESSHIHLEKVDVTTLP